jgi:fructokinase
LCNLRPASCSEFAGFGRATEEYADAHLSASALPASLLTSGPVILVTGTLGLAQPDTAAAVRRAVDLVRSAGKGGSVLVDVNWRPVFWSDPAAALPLIREYVHSVADVVKITDQEAAWMLGADPARALADPASVLQHLPRARGVLVTAGEKGASYCFRGTGGKLLDGFAPVLQVPVVDTTGAGDAFTGGFLYAVLQAGGLEQVLSDPAALDRAVRVASAAGALTCTGPGAIAPQPTADKIEALLRETAAEGARTPSPRRAAESA